jgi:hypothetical protein
VHPPLTYLYKASDIKTPIYDIDVYTEIGTLMYLVNFSD